MSNIYDEEIKYLQKELSIISRLQIQLVTMTNQNKNRVQRKLDKYNKKCEKTKGINNEATRKFSESIRKLNTKARKKKYSRDINESAETILNNIFEKQRIQKREYENIYREIRNILDYENIYTALERITKLQQEKRKELKIKNQEKSEKLSKTAELNKENNEQKPQEMKINSEEKYIENESQIKKTNTQTKNIEQQYKQKYSNTKTTIQEPEHSISYMRLERLGKLNKRTLNKLNERQFKTIIESLAELYKDATKAMQKELLNVYTEYGKENQKELSQLTQKKFQEYEKYHNIILPCIPSLSQEKQEIYKELAKETVGENYTSFININTIKNNINSKVITNLPEGHLYKAKTTLERDNIRNENMIERVNEFTKYMDEEQIVKFYKRLKQYINQYYTGYNSYASNEEERKAEIELAKTTYENDLINLQKIFIFKILNKNKMDYSIESVQKIIEEYFDEQLIKNNKELFEKFSNYENEEENNKGRSR